jgi:phage terminase large subunit
MEITLPHKFTPRPYQLPLLSAMDSGFKRGVAVWHRRSGKDKTFINIAAKKAFERKGGYFYYFPTLSQGRKIIWDGMDRDGFKFLDHIPSDLISNKNNQEMKITLVNGSIFQVVGTDRIEVVGTNPVGCVFSEYSLQDPKAWDLIRPILAENDGWSIFNFTPRGMNHGYKLFNMAESNPEWFVSLLTVDDTGAIPIEAVEAERRAGMSEELIQQEFYCSFEYGLEGAYYAKYVAKARQEGRIVDFPIEDKLVHTAWDLGISDAMSIWFFQLIGREIHIIDYYENQGEGFPHYADVLKDKPYHYGNHYGPHDIKVREIGTGKSRESVARDLGITFKIAPNVGIMDGIEAVRSIFKRCWFHRTNTEHGLNALMNYQKSYNEKHNVFSKTPLHNWASHGADAFRYLALVVDNVATGGRMTQSRYNELRRKYGPPR